MAHDTVPREAGAIFARTRPKLAVRSRIVHLSSDQIPPGPVERLIADEPLSGWSGFVAQFPPFAANVRSVLCPECNREGHASRCG
jgi:hypothetical protein